MSVVTEDQLEVVSKEFHNRYFQQLESEAEIKFHPEKDSWDNWNGGEQHRNSVRNTIREMIEDGVITLGESFIAGV